VGATGILGGTFDPVHNAHLAMARAALAVLGLARVVFMPTGATHYRAPAAASGAQRAAMLRLATAGEPRFAVDERELDPAHSGYTVDTLARLGYRPVLLMGTDQYAKRESWHRWPEVARRADVAVFARPGWHAVLGEAKLVPLEPMAVSASDIRARVARAEPIDDLVPPAVAGYIRREGLYR